MNGLEEENNNNEDNKYFIELKPENILLNENRKINIIYYGIDYLKELKLKD